MGNTYYIGWDVGAWECPSKPFASKSQDCLVVLNEKKEMIWAWLGNVYAKLEKEDNSFFDFLARLNKSEQSVINKKEDREKNEDHEAFSITEQDNVVIAIDAVLGLPLQACQLFDLNNETTPCFPQEREKCKNPLIFRKTEMSISEEFKTTPLSLLKDRIGSQSTKALFSLKKWGMKWDTDSFVWKCGNVTAIETYPAILGGPDFPHNDENDAKLCAELAQKFAADADKDDDKKELLYPKREEIKSAKQEGWIWVPRSCLPDTTKDASCPTP